jgi:hypothetical protein
MFLTGRYRVVYKKKVKIFIFEDSIKSYLKLLLYTNYKPCWKFRQVKNYSLWDLVLGMTKFKNVPMFDPNYTFSVLLIVCGYNYLITLTQSSSHTFFIYGE